MKKPDVDFVYGLSPDLWIIWHNHAHHGHTNTAEHDPDTFGTLERFLMNRLRTVWQVICALIVLGLVVISIDGSSLFNW